MRERSGAEDPHDEPEMAIAVEGEPEVEVKKDLCFWHLPHAI